MTAANQALMPPVFRRESKNRIVNPMFSKWLQDDQETRELFGYSMNSWLSLIPRTTNVLGVPVDGVGNRTLAIQNGVKYYDQDLVALYLSAGLNQADSGPESIRDFLTEIGINPRRLLNFLKPRYDRTILNRVYGVPEFELEVAGSSSTGAMRNPKPWIYQAVIDASNVLFHGSDTLRIQLSLRAKIIPDAGTWNRVGKIKIPNFIFATFDLAKNDIGLSYSFFSEYIPEELAITFLKLDSKLSERKSDNPIRNKRMVYFSSLKQYQRSENHLR